MRFHVFLALMAAVRSPVGLESSVAAVALSWAVITLVFHSAFAAGVARDAAQRLVSGEGTELVGKWWWVGVVFLGGLPAMVLYWLVNCSS